MPILCQDRQKWSESLAESRTAVKEWCDLSLSAKMTLVLPPISSQCKSLSEARHGGFVVRAIGVR
jgi:hypothetical protein